MQTQWYERKPRMAGLQLEQLIWRERKGAMNRDPMWKIIWKWKEIKRIRVFLWIVAHNVVMTNDKRWRRRISDNRCLLSFCVMKWKL